MNPEHPNDYSTKEASTASFPNKEPSANTHNIMATVSPNEFNNGNATIDGKEQHSSAPIEVVVSKRKKCKKAKLATQYSRQKKILKLEEGVNDQGRFHHTNGCGDQLVPPFGCSLSSFEKLDKKEKNNFENKEQERDHSLEPSSRLPTASSSAEVQKTTSKRFRINKNRNAHFAHEQKQVVSSQNNGRKNICAKTFEMDELTKEQECNNFQLVCDAFPRNKRLIAQKVAKTDGLPIHEANAIQELVAFNIKRIELGDAFKHQLSINAIKIREHLNRCGSSKFTMKWGIHEKYYIFLVYLFSFDVKMKRVLHPIESLARIELKSRTHRSFEHKRNELIKKIKCVTRTCKKVNN